MLAGENSQKLLQLFYVNKCKKGLISYKALWGKCVVLFLLHFVDTFVLLSNFLRLGTLARIPVLNLSNPTAKNSKSKIVIRDCSYC